jgi:hypothetical protein
MSVSTALLSRIPPVTIRLSRDYEWCVVFFVVLVNRTSSSSIEVRDLLRPSKSFACVVLVILKRCGV